MRRSRILMDCGRTLFLLAAAYFVSDFLMGHGGENSCALVHVLALVFICRLTDGYVYGVVASFAATFSINFFFMYPYAEFNFLLTGYPLTIAITLAVSLTVSALASRAKREEYQAIRREQQTRLLYEQNEALAEERTAVQVKAAQEKMRGDLLRAVSHDLRTPLTGISGACSVLLTEDVTKEHSRELLSGIRDNAEWLISVVENLLAVTRVEDQTATIHKQDEPAEEVAAHAIIKMRSRFPDVRIRLNMPDDLLLAPMDPLLIEQVLLNLLENAARHSQAPDSVELSISGVEQGVDFRVSDRGRGFPPAVLEDLRGGAWLDMSGDSGQGAGIGLSVCRSIIDFHGGSFYADNRQDGGAEIGFILPARRKDEGEGDAEGEDHEQ